MNNDNFATIDAQNNPSNLSSIYENDSNSESEAVVENCTIFHSTSKEKSLVVLKRNGSGALESMPCY